MKRTLYFSQRSISNLKPRSQYKQSRIVNHYWCPLRACFKPIKAIISSELVKNISFRDQNVDHDQSTLGCELWLLWLDCFIIKSCVNPCTRIIHLSSVMLKPVEGPYPLGICQDGRHVKDISDMRLISFLSAYKHGDWLTWLTKVFRKLLALSGSQYNNVIIHVLFSDLNY